MADRPFTMLQTQFIKDWLLAYDRDEISSDTVRFRLDSIGYDAPRLTRSVTVGRVTVRHKATGKTEIFDI